MAFSFSDPRAALRVSAGTPVALDRVDNLPGYRQALRDKHQVTLAEGFPEMRATVYGRLSRADVVLLVAFAMVRVFADRHGFGGPGFDTQHFQLAGAGRFFDQNPVHQINRPAGPTSVFGSHEGRRLRLPGWKRLSCLIFLFSVSIDSGRQLFRVSRRRGRAVSGEASCYGRAIRPV